ncbi:hypothetical protein ACV35Z_38825 [Pseudomonas aeruginosa]
MEIANNAIMIRLETLFSLQGATAKVITKLAQTAHTKNACSSSSSLNRDKSVQEVADPNISHREEVKPSV